MLISQLLHARFNTESVNMLPKLGDSIHRLITLKAQATDFVVDKASYHFEFHDSVVTQVHVLCQVSIGCTVKSARLGNITYILLQRIENPTLGSEAAI